MSAIAWEEVNWPLVNARILRYQTRIFKASRANNIPKVRCLQKRLLKSLDAKLVAVRQVTTLNKGRRITGVNKQIFVSDLQKGKLVERLRLDGNILPIPRVYVDKPGKLKKRSFDVPTVKDRAKQALCKLALEPEWEARFETDSYGFRPGRCWHDAMEAIFLSLRNNAGDLNYSKYVLYFDINNCFDQITHDYLINKLETIPEIEKEIKACLKNSILEEFLDVEKETNILESIMGTPQRSIISTLLANIALHGLENHMKEWICNKPSFAKTNRYNKDAKQQSLTLIRYGGVFVLIHKEETIVRQAKEEIAKWLWDGPRIKLSEGKTSICKTDNGFDFLGFSIITITRGNISKTKIYPSNKSQELLLLKVRNIIQNNRSVSAYNLINLLRPIILDWANYFKYSECSIIYRKLKHLVFQKIRAWVFRRDTRNGRDIVKQRYFPSGKFYTFEGTRYRNNWVLNGQQLDKNGVLKKNWLPHLDWVKSEKWVKIQGTKSPFDGDNLYWEKRTQNKGNLTLRQRELIKLQNGVFP